MTQPQTSTNPLRMGYQSLQKLFATTQIAGRPLSWYLSGWRGAGIWLILAIALPNFINQSLLNICIGISIYVILALGLNVVVGYAGLLDLGYVAFFVIGAYVASVFSTGTIYNRNGDPVTILTLPFWLIIPLGAVIAAFFGVLLGAPTLRLRGDYLAIVTLGFGEIVPIFFQVTPFFGGNFGATALPIPDINTPFGVVSLNSITNLSGFYYLTLFLVVLVILLTSSLRDSSLGRAWIAIREDETAAAASGVNLVRTKLLAFGIGAGMGGLGGVIYALNIFSISPTNFSFTISITILTMVVLGGLGSIPGVIIGAIILQFTDNYILTNLQQTVRDSAFVSGANSPLAFLAKVDFNQAKYLFYGMILIAIVLLRPQGLIPDRRRARDRASVSND